VVGRRDLLLGTSAMQRQGRASLKTRVWPSALPHMGGRTRRPGAENGGRVHDGLLSNLTTFRLLSSIVK
jgi:hypothetical protein